MPMPSAAAAQSHAPVVVETRVIETVRKPVAEEQATVPLPPRQIAIGAPVPAEVPELGKSEADTSAAGATALGVLAAGLAVASAQPQPVAAPQAAAAPAVAPAAPATAAAAPVRSLEDAVAEMLRPMLQQWLTDHMPRIIEKALKIETAPSVKDASK